jgi:hypothetical protein
MVARPKPMPAMKPLSVERLKVKSSSPVSATDRRLRVRKAEKSWVATNQNAGVSTTAAVSSTAVSTETARSSSRSMVSWMRIPVHSPPAIARPCAPPGNSRATAIVIGG